MEDELFAMYDEGLRKILDVITEEQRDELAADGAVASVLLAHGLFPVSLEQRVAEALDEVRPYLRSHDGDIEYLGISDNIVRLRMTGSCDGCGASAATLEAAVETALRAAAPDLDGMDVEGATRPPPERPPASSPEWEVLPVDPTRGETASARGLMVANVAGTLLAYKDWCAGCPAPLSSGMLVGGTLTCTACGRSYDLPRAGREKDGDLQLEPVPLLRSGGEVKVSLPPAEAERGPRPRGALRAVPGRPERAPPAPAQPRRAAHRLRLRDVLVAALGRRGVPRDRRAHAVARRLRARRRGVGRRSRSRSGWR